MNKKLMAVAVAGALAVPAVAFAQASSVTISGRANVGLDSYEAPGATAGSASDFKRRTRIFDAGSRLIFQGTENLGGGLTAYFYNESGVNFDTGGSTGQANTVNTNTGFLGSRNAWLGLRGGWGAFQFGKPNVWWGNGAIFMNAGASFFTTEIPFLTGGLGRGMGPGVARQPNTMTYITPVMGGVTATVHYSTNGGSSLVAQSSQESAAAGANANAHMWAFTANGLWGPWNAQFDWVKGWGNSPAVGSQGTSDAWKANFQYRYNPGGTVKIYYLRAHQENGGSGATPSAALLGLGTNLTQNAWAIGWDHTFGNFVPTVQLGKVNNISGCAISRNCDSTGATSWQVGVRYVMSKRTWSYAHVVNTSNQANYNMDYTGGNISSANLPTTSNGADPRIFGVGLVHFF